MTLVLCLCLMQNIWSEASYVNKCMYILTILLTNYRLALWTSLNMGKTDTHLVQKMWGLKFLIEQFYYEKGKLMNNKTVLLDKMQTFWMLYAPFLKDGMGPDKAMAANFMNFLRNRRTPLYDLEKKPSIEEIDAWFSSPVKRKRFMDIYSNDLFDFSNPNDVVLAFNLADGVLEKPEIREYAVLESLYFRRKGIGSFSDNKVDKFQEEFSRDFKKSDNNYFRSFLEGFTREDIEDAYRELNDDVVSYFQYQKRNGYPMINVKLYQLWVEDVFVLMDFIINKIKSIMLSNKDSLLESYFPNVSNKERPVKDFNYYGLYVYLDDHFGKKFTSATNDLPYLIMQIFSHVDLDCFGICANESCRQRRLFVKFPKANKEYCSNLCAAYAATYKKRNEEKKTRNA